MIADAARACAAALELPQTQGRHVVMVGRFASNAWADLFGGAPTCFYALELIPDARTLGIMAAHETAHALHFGTSDLPVDGASVAETLLKEGLATAASEAVTPGLGDGIYLWPGFDETPEGERVTAWLERCHALRAELAEQLLRDLSSRDPRVLGRYFTMSARHRHERTPTRAGYAVGLWLVRQLGMHHSLGDLARWPRERARREVKEALSAF